MFTYVALMKFTDQGFKSIKESPARAQQAAEGIRKAGGKLLSMHYTQGEYDMVSVVQWPSEEVGTAFGLALASQGNVTMQTLRAFSVEEMSDIVKKIP